MHRRNNRDYHNQNRRGYYSNWDNPRPEHAVVKKTSHRNKGNSKHSITTSAPTPNRSDRWN